MPREARSSSSYTFRSCFLISLLFAAQMQQSQSIICYQLVNAPTSLGDDIITYKSWAKKEKLRKLHAAQQQHSSSMLLFSSKSCLLRGSLAGTSRASPSSWALLPWQWSSRTVPGFLVPIGETLSLSLSAQQLYTELAAQFMSELGPFCLMITFKCLVGGWFRTNYIIFRNAEIFLI
jgi:hypothetical protein